MPTGRMKFDIPTVYLITKSEPIQVIQESCLFLPLFNQRNAMILSRFMVTLRLRVEAENKNRGKRGQSDQDEME